MPATSIPGRARARRLFGLGRRRVEHLADGLADDLADGAARYAERGRDLVDELVDEATPLVDRALNRRRRSRKRRAAGLMLVVALVVACAGVVAWLAWREPRDEEFARLRPDPDEPNIAPAGSDGPAVDTPRATPAPAATDVGGVAPSEHASDPAPTRDPVATPMNRAPRVRVFGGVSLPQAVAVPAFAPARAPLPTPVATRPRLPF